MPPPRQSCARTFRPLQRARNGGLGQPSEGDALGAHVIREGRSSRCRCSDALGVRRLPARPRRPSASREIARARSPRTSSRCPATPAHSYRPLQSSWVMSMSRFLGNGAPRRPGTPRRRPSAGDVHGIDAVATNGQRVAVDVGDVVSVGSHSVDATGRRTLRSVTASAGSPAEAEAAAAGSRAAPAAGTGAGSAARQAAAGAAATGTGTAGTETAGCGTGGCAVVAGLRGARPAPVPAAGAGLDAGGRPAVATRASRPGDRRRAPWRRLLGLHRSRCGLLLRPRDAPQRNRAAPQRPRTARGRRTRCRVRQTARLGPLHVRSPRCADRGIPGSAGDDPGDKHRRSLDRQAADKRPAGCDTAGAEERLEGRGQLHRTEAR